ncbi:hypothetical protein CEXT_309611 [Caerostris extrusa]|uniref:Uncharacterized protein n=1 Tax=Caerostris extrusa TaxID=172846 RepID=A0AAV4NJD9_CAEEX|nr:hypothetical protein CEXT_309611 [Caerostris extrusa]
MKSLLSFREMTNRREGPADAIMEGEIHNCRHTKSLKSTHTHHQHPIEMNPNRCVRPQGSMFALGLWATHAKRAEIETLPQMLNRFSLGCNRNGCKKAPADDVSILLRGY